MDKVLNDKKYSGLYISLVEAAYQNGGKSYNGGDYEIYNDLGANVHLRLAGFTGNEALETMRHRTDKLLSLKGRESFLESLNRAKDVDIILKNSELEALRMIGGSELAEYFARKKAILLERTERERQEQRKAYEAEQKAEQERIEQQKAEQLKAAEESLKQKKRTLNENGVILELMRKHGVKVPLKTQGWILDKLIAVCFDNGTTSYQYRKDSRSSHGSKTFFRCLDDLMCQLA